jgi:hypothetical protein
VEVRDLNHHFLRARSAATLWAWNCGLLRIVTAGEKRLVSGPAWASRWSGSFTVYPALSRPSQPPIAARLLPAAEPLLLRNLSPQRCKVRPGPYGGRPSLASRMVLAWRLAW